MPDKREGNPAVDKISCMITDALVQLQKPVVGERWDKSYFTITHYAILSRSTGGLVICGLTEENEILVAVDMIHTIHKRTQIIEQRNFSTREPFSCDEDGGLVIGYQNRARVQRWYTLERAVAEGLI